jgi:hypothetical protein
MKSLSESEIIYRDFWDVPRIFIVRHNAQYYLFDCEFIEFNEDYSEEYAVYEFPLLSDDVVAGSWEDFSGLATVLLGHVPVRDVAFDPSHRESIDASIVDRFLCGEDRR